MKPYKYENPNEWTICRQGYEVDEGEDAGMIVYHRLDGPAVKRNAQGLADGFEHIWYYHGRIIKVSSQKEFEQLLKYMDF